MGGCRQWQARCIEFKHVEIHTWGGMTKRLGVTAYETTDRTHVVSKGRTKETDTRADPGGREPKTHRRSASCGTCEHEFNEAWSVFSFERQLPKQGTEFDAQETYLHSSTTLSWKRSNHTRNDKTSEQTSNWSGLERVRCENSTHEALIFLLCHGVHGDLCACESKR